MASIRSRIEAMEGKAKGDPYEALRQAGISEERIGEVSNPTLDGMIDWSLLHLEELEAVCEVMPDEVGDTGVKWAELSDRQLEAIIDGVPPRKVLGNRW